MTDDDDDDILEAKWEKTLCALEDMENLHHEVVRVGLDDFLTELLKATESASPPSTPEVIARLDEIWTRVNAISALLEETRVYLEDKEAAEA